MTSKESSCFLCSNKIGTKRHGVSLFSEARLVSGRKLRDVVEELIGTPLADDEDKTRTLCRACNIRCVDYDEALRKANDLKSDFKIKFQATQKKTPVKEENATKSTKSPKKKLVLPASKLKPLPANYVVVNKDLSKTIPKIEPQTSTSDIKPTSKGLNLADLLKSSTVMSAMTNLIDDFTTISRDVNQTDTARMITLDATSLDGNDIVSVLNDSTKSDQEPKENAMEIDEECTYSTSALPTNADTNEYIVEGGTMNVELEAASDPLDALYDDNQKFVIRKVEIMDEDDANDDGTETYVMADDSGSILQVLSSGQILNDARLREHIEDLDSNDENQIELQVSGDEETANAIIAATNEKGGAFIKVESGEMYRVKAVKSKIQEDEPAGIVEKDGDTYKCLLCSNRSKDDVQRPSSYCSGDVSGMLSHVRSEHGARLYACAPCDLLFTKKAQYTEHIAKHNDQSLTITAKKYQCNVCAKKYGSSSLLSQHMNKHSGERPYCCPHCDKNFQSKYTFRSHLKIHGDRPRNHKCMTCHKAFYTPHALIQHEKTHLLTRDYVCKICGKAFLTQHNLEVHGIVHTGDKPFECGLCGKRFARKAEIRDHMRTHTGERPFKCDMCPSSFSQRSNLRSHKRATHLQDARHACQQCEKRFKRRRLLDYHIKSAHTGERPFACEVCHASFVYPEHYKKHIRIHSGDKPYVCEVCGKGFNSRDNRNTHRFVHSDKKPYECLVCGAGYMRRPHLLAHMNTCGHLTESIVVNQPRVADGAETEILSIIGANKETEDASKDESQPPGVYITNENNKIYLSDGSSKTELNIATEGQETTTFLSLTQDMLDKSNISLVESSDAPRLQMVSTENTLLRLVQVKLPNGTDGWIAINNL